MSIFDPEFRPYEMMLNVHKIEEYLLRGTSQALEMFCSGEKAFAGASTIQVARGVVRLLRESFVLVCFSHFLIVVLFF